MKSMCLHERTAIEQVLRENVYLQIYSIGDLDEFFWPYTTWYATEDDTGINTIALLYSGQSLPTLLALSEKPDHMRGLLESIAHLLPPRFYAHFSPGVESVLDSIYQHGNLMLQETWIRGRRFLRRVYGPEKMRIQWATIQSM